MGGASIFYPNSVLRWPSISRPKLGISVFSLKDCSTSFATQRDHFSFSVSSIRSDGNRRGRPPRKSTGSGRTSKGSESETPKSTDESTSSASSNQDEIIALFRRIQSSISKGESVQNKRTTKPAESSAKSILEVLHQSRKQGKASDKDRVKVLPQRRGLPKNSRKIQEKTLVVDSKPNRPPSNFFKRSPIPYPTAPRGKTLEQSKETAWTEAESINKTYLTDTNNERSTEVDKMKLSELKELAKSRGIKGYSKLKKSELMGLLRS